MYDVKCPFCDVEGFVVENDMTSFEKSNGEENLLWGIQFTEHYGSCPFKGIPCHRANYTSKEEAISAYSIKKCQCTSK